jgi:hypothetical protein
VPSQQFGPRRVDAPTGSGQHQRPDSGEAIRQPPNAFDTRQLDLAHIASLSSLPLLRVRMRRLLGWSDNGNGTFTGRFVMPSSRAVVAACDCMV